VIVKERKTHAAAMVEPAPVDRRLAMGTLQSIDENGMLLVALDAKTVQCLWLNSNPAAILETGDKVLVALVGSEHIVMGVAGPYRVPTPQKRLTLEATEVLTLKCGEVSIDLRAADGKLMLRGEDVLLRAKGTQRIKAGSVSIN